MSILVGRTGRGGKVGAAYTFISGKEFNALKNIQRFTKANITRIEPPTKLDIEKSRMNILF
jgi:ATP-dependent RNA helicase DeaD